MAQTAVIFTCVNVRSTKAANLGFISIKQYESLVHGSKHWSAVKTKLDKI